MSSTNSSEVDKTAQQIENLSVEDKKEKEEEDEPILKETAEEDDPSFAVKHPLQNRWTLWYDNPGKRISPDAWADNLKKVVTFDTVEDFWRIFNNIRPASSLQPGSNYHLFKEHIEPKWEHIDNLKGGKWIVNVKNRNANLDQQWMWIVLACIGESFEDENEICGCVVSVRKNQDRISLWTKSAMNETAQRNVGVKLKRALEMPDNMTIGYQMHSDSLKRNSSFNNRNRYEV